MALGPDQQSMMNRAKGYGRATEPIRQQHDRRQEMWEASKELDYRLNYLWISLDLVISSRALNVSIVI